MRIGLWAAFVLMATTGLGAWFSWLLLKSALEQQEKSWLQDVLREGRFALRSEGIRGLQRRFADMRGTEKSLYFLRLDGPGNQALFLNDPTGHAKITRHIQSLDPRQTGAWLDLDPEETEGAWFLTAEEVQPGVFLQVGKNAADSDRLLDSYLRKLLMFLVPTVVLGAAGIVLVAHRATRHAHTLAEAIRGIVTTGELKKRVAPPGGGAEFDELARLFNEMLARHESLVATMHESLDNVAHDLRTPMTRLRTIAESAVAANPETTDVESLRNALFDSVEEADRVIAMLNAMMDVAEAEAGAMKLHLESVPVRRLLETAAEFHEFVAEERQIRIVVDDESDTSPDAPLCVRGDPGRLQQVFSNLVDNAVKFSDPETTVTLKIRPAGTDVNMVEIEVADNGPGIPPEEIPHIWNRLYRAERARSKRGLGLGLSLVKAIVEAHGGTVSVQSTPGAGSRFIVRLPKAE